jgi:hypothetical protein
MKATSTFGVLCVAALVSSIHAQTVLQTINGSAGDRLGVAAIVAGDQNGDGFTDVLVGAPGFNSGSGAVRCVSGRFLATGTLPSVLWSITSPPVNSGAAFGTALVSVGNLTGDSATDFVVSAPNYIPTGAFDSRGAIFLVDGSTHAIASYIQGLPQTHFGQVMVAVGDQTGDFKTDIAVSAPDVSSSVASTVHVVPGAAFGFATQLATISHASHTGGWHEYGAALASGFDYDGDGKFDLAISIPDYGFSFPGAGYIEVRKANSFGIIQAYTTNVTGEHFGASIDVTTDYNGDGTLDLVVGAPNWNGGNGVEDGRVLVLSGSKFVNPSLPGPIEIFTLTQGFSSFVFDYHFGTAVRASRDLNNDGVGEILVGAPDYTSIGGGGSFFNKGLVSIFSGATGTRLALIVGGNTDRLGDSITGAAEDFNGDGFDEFVVAGSLSDAGGTDSGVVKCYRLFPTQPATYCTGKPNSLGCVPSMSWSGSASATSATPFLITCSNVLNQVGGVLLYSHTPNAAPFQGGTLCVKAPLRRTSTQNSGGSASGSDCTGAFSFDFNARIQSGVDPTLVVGSEVFNQYWSRDPASPSSTSLSNGLRFLINP